MSIQLPGCPPAAVNSPAHRRFCSTGPQSGPPILGSDAAFSASTADPTNRLNEIRAMIESMQPDLDAGKTMLLLGDLNHGLDTDEYQLWMDAGWVDTFAKVGKDDGPTIKSDIPKWRIDDVIAAGPIAERVIGLSI
ncbi:hypothetical protein SH528x_005225 [Novipirellula sp. SH528]|uniref:hypothetical protein n=1 Tax=Novipirellula sp. SH528 TaxID=3454466 RepID=UPI003FA11E44